MNVAITRWIALTGLFAGLLSACSGEADSQARGGVAAGEAAEIATLATGPDRAGDEVQGDPGSGAATSTDDTGGSEAGLTGNNPAIWQLQDEDTTIYLFGTVHLLSENTNWQNERLLNLFDGSDAVYFETDDSPGAEAVMGSLIPQIGMLEEGKTLNDFIATDRQADIAEFLSSLGLTPASTQPMRPWLVNVIVGVMLVQKAGGDPEKGVDKLLGQRADERGIPRRFLETAEQQLGFFADIPDQQSADLLIETVDQYKEMPDLFSDLEAAWSAGDVEELWRLVAESMTGNEWFMDILLFNRNKDWAETFDKLMDEEAGTFFVAVGAGHLAGGNSVQHFMALKGHEAERL